MYLDTNNAWFARSREHRRVERQAAREREHRDREHIDRLLAEHPVGRARYAKAPLRLDRGRSAMSKAPTLAGQVATVADADRTAVIIEGGSLEGIPTSLHRRLRPEILRRHTAADASACVDDRVYAMLRNDGALGRFFDGLKRAS